MEKYKITYQGKKIEIEKLPNGKFKIPPLGQFTKQGLGSVWLDEGRIPYEKGGTIASNPKLRVDGGYKTETGDRVFCQGELGKKNTMVENAMTGGRFPANLLVSDDVLNDGRVRQSGGNSKLIQRTGSKTNNIYGKYIDNKSYSEQPASSGSFSRYFSLDSWFDKKLKELPEGVRRTFPFLIVPKASKAEKNRGLENKGYTRKCRWNNTGEWKNLETKKYGNNHPTVKPIKLMSYLITLGSREGDIILDPFVGSGTTAIAAKMLDRQYIGYEINKEYFEIAKARLKAVTTQLSLFKRD